MTLKIYNKKRPHPSNRSVHIVYFILSLVGSGFLFSGCAPKYYTPNTHNVPLLQRKGESTLSVAIGGGPELQGAYAITDRLALMLNMASMESSKNEDGGSGRLLEFGLGYYLPLSEKVVFETYGLVGGGDVENHFPSTLSAHPTTTGKIESKLFRWGMQSAVGFKTKYLDVAASTRITSLHYSDISGSLIFSGEDQVQYLNRENSHLLIEPGITLRGGYDFLKLQVQLGKSINLSHSDFKQDEEHFTVGIVYHLDKSASKRTSFLSTVP